MHKQLQKLSYKEKLNCKNFTIKLLNKHKYKTISYVMQ